MSDDVMSQDAIDRLLRELAEGKSVQDTDSEQTQQQFIATDVHSPHTGRHGRRVETAKTQIITSHKIRNYDFRRPNRISKEHMRGLRLIHETFSRDIPRAWGPLLRAGGQVKIISMEQTIYEEFRNHLSPHCLLCTVVMPPMEGEFVIHIEQEASFIFIDRLLGGNGSVLKRSREFTTLELGLLQKVINALLPAWREAWLPVLMIEPVIVRTLANTEFLQLTAVNESVLVTTFQIHFLNTEIEMTFCIPYSIIAPILTRVNAREEAAGQIGSDHFDKQRMLKHMQQIHLDVSARIGSTPIPIAELAKLNIGDVIRLDVPGGGMGKVYVSGQPHFVAQPGLFNGGLSVQIKDIIKNID